MFAVPAAAQGPPAPVFAWPPSVFATADPGPKPKPTGLAVGHLVGWDTDGWIPGPSDNVWKDVVVVNRERKTLAIFANTGIWNSEFVVPLVRLSQTISLDFGDPYDVRVADLDQDGDQDIIVAIMGEPQVVAIIRNKNDGSFDDAQIVALQYATTIGPSRVMGLAVGNFNGQGGADIAVTGGAATSLSIELLLDIDGSGAFTHQEFIPPASLVGMSTIAASRFRSTTPVGFVDLVVGSIETNHLFVMRNNGDGTWNTLFDPLSGGKTWNIAPAWFHAGVARDIVFGEDNFFGTDFAFPSFNDGNGDFTPRPGQLFSVFKDPYGAAAGKLNADNTVDVAIACTSGIGDFPPGSLFQLPGPVTAIHGGVAVFMYDAENEILGAPLLIDIDPGNMPKPCFLKITDMNRDGRKDIVAACTESGNLSVLMNGLAPEKEDSDG
ncbi:MAG: VCBS repeat-containing protein [Planctomycetes bacterium]|nr:VCBS repeat-containing protein [Planctomycetota bacterium]